MSISDYLENAILNASLRNVSLAVATPYVALFTANPGETGASGEATGGSYARQAATFNVPASGLSDNVALISYTNMPASTITHIAIFDAVSAGNMLYAGALGGTQHFFSANATTDVFTAYGHGLVNDDRVEFEEAQAGSLPTGITAGTLYYVISATTDTYQVSLTSAGAAVNFTTSGQGVATYVNAKVVNAGDTFQVAAGDLDVSLF